MTFDQWRSAYDEMSFREHQAYNSELARLYPVQESYNAKAVYRFLRERPHAKVVELGGWDGKLADKMLRRFSGVETWVNFDLTPDVPQVCDDVRYHRVPLIDWPWKCVVRGDVLIASHVFEHMRISEVEATLQMWPVRSVFVDCPIYQAQDWRGYNGTHILEVGASEFLERVAGNGWNITHWDTSDGLIAHLDR
jgi:hypothetical protein